MAKKGVTKAEKSKEKIEGKTRKMKKMKGRKMKMMMMTTKLVLVEFFSCL